MSKMTTAEKRNKVAEEFLLSLYHQKQMEMENEYDNDIENWFMEFCDTIYLDEFSTFIKTKNKTTQQLFNKKRFLKEEYISYADEYFDNWRENRFQKNDIQVLMDFLGYSEFSLK